MRVLQVIDSLPLAEAEVLVKDMAPRLRRRIDCHVVVLCRVRIFGAGSREMSEASGGAPGLQYRKNIWILMLRWISSCFNEYAGNGVPG